MEGDGLDDRFKKVLTDPRFKKFRSKGRKIKVDSRFEKMFDKRFNGEPLIDKRGKRVKKTDNDNLRKFYEVEENVKKIRGECNDVESSSSDESSEEEEEVEDENETAEQIDSKVLRTDDVTCRFAVTNVDWDQLKAVDLFVLFNSFKPSNGEILSVKIYLSQFGKERLEAEKLEGPKELTEVKLEDEEEDPFESNNGDADEIINTDCPFVSEKLRKYQLNRLKYYYAVVECDSPDTAATLYDQLDGMEYESSASTLDLRFIPDDMTFDDDEPTSVCHEMPSLIDYKPPLFITTALQQTKVRLTWDETDPNRAKTLERAFTERDKISDDLACYLASSSEEEADELSDEEEITEGLEGKSFQDRISKYKDLLASVEKGSSDDEKDIDMEVKWEPELEDIGQKIVERKQKEKMSFAERQLAERKEKRKELKKLKKQSVTEAPEEDSDNENEESEGDDEQYHASNKQSDDSDENSNDEDTKNQDDLELLVMDSTKKDKKHFDYSDFVENKKSKKKWRKKKDKPKQQEDNFKFDAEDPRFGAIYKSHLYNVDQSNSHFKKTQAYEEILKRKASIDPDTKYSVKKSK